MTATLDSRPMPDLDIPPGSSAAGDTDPWACTECGQPVAPTPTGRKPRLMLCEEHRGNRTSGSSGTKSAGSTHNKVKDGVLAIHVLVAMGVGAVSIPTGDKVWITDRDIIANNADNIAEQWAKATDVNPRLRKSVLKFLDMAGSLSLIGAYVPVAIAITMNHKNQSPPPPVGQDRPDMAYGSHEGVN